jgi:hypothetical protein
MLTEQELLSLITRRRALSGESYEKARKAVIEHLRDSGRISAEECQRLLNTRTH